MDILTHLETRQNWDLEVTSYGFRANFREDTLICRFVNCFGSHMFRTVLDLRIQDVCSLFVRWCSIQSWQPWRYQKHLRRITALNHTKCSMRCEEIGAIGSLGLGNFHHISPTWISLCHVVPFEREP